MSTYVFKVADLAGAKSSGEGEAESKQALASQLKARGLIVLDISDKGGGRNLSINFGKRVSVNELSVFSRQLATLIMSGVSILRSLNVLDDQTENKFLKETIVAVRRQVEGGLSFGDALEQHPKIFNQLFVSMVRAGESGGVLEQSLQRVADQLEKDASLRRQIRSAMVYPILVMSFAFIVLAALVSFLVPVFEGVFKEFGGNLPGPTKVSVALSHAFTKTWFGFVPGILGIVIVMAGVATSFVKWKNSKRGRPYWDRFRLHVPMKIGSIVQEIAVARWSRTLASLTSAGVPLLQALDITGKTAGNVVVEDAMADVIASVKRGGTLTAPLSKAPIFPKMVTHMVGVGEETGELDTMLAKVADFYEDRVAISVKGLTSLLEPIMIIVIGSIVGFIVVSMYLPLFELYQHIQ
ncbi:MAG: type II secretion system F family protein [Solirubrobacteraceae bacterium]